MGVINDIDRDIISGKFQKKDMFRKKAYQDFLKQHCHQRHYTFQIIKCGDDTCYRPRRMKEDLEWVPDPVLSVENKGHYQVFGYLDTKLAIKTFLISNN